jgi:ATP-dependent DNA helicase RecG
LGRNDKKLGRNDDKVGNRVGNRLSEHQIEMIELILDNSKISAQKLSDIVGISKRKIEENLAKLKENGILERVGGTRGYWVVLKDNIRKR